MATEFSSSFGKLAEALSKAQGQFLPASKSSFNPHFKSKYADLASVWEVIRGPLSDNGLAVVQTVGTTDSNDLQVSTILMHSSGEYVKDTCVFPVVQKTPQGIGSAVTYARRYTLSALVGVAADVDDDGDAASKPAAQAKTKPAPAKGEPPLVDKLLLQLDAADSVDKVNDLAKDIKVARDEELIDDADRKVLLKRYSDRMTALTAAKLGGTVNQ